MAPIPAQVAQSFSKPPEGLDIGALEFDRIPAHIAVIMDGNGRWAKRRGLPRIAGHKAGVTAVRELIVAANDLGVRFLTIYSFSTENWNRPKDEVSGLMSLFAEVLGREIDALHEKGVRVKLLGRVEALPAKTRDTFLRGVEKTADNQGMTLAIAVNYGSRTEMVDAARLVAQDVRDGVIAVDDIDEDVFAGRLYTAGMPDPELVIRTSGEMRLSNFLLWQVAYSEFWITEKFWPDFTRYDLAQAILDYQTRERRFGGA